jgi:hypothetical protein
MYELRALSSVLEPFFIVARAFSSVFAEKKDPRKIFKTSTPSNAVL